MHRQGSACCAQGVVRLRVWSVEYRHEGVAHELHHGATLPEHDRHDHTECSVEHCHDLGGSSPFRELRISAQVREEDGNFELLPTELRAVRVLDERRRDLRRQISVKQLVHLLAQGGDEPALGEGSSLGPFQRVGAHARGDDPDDEDEDSEKQFRREPEPQGEHDEQEAVRAAHQDRPGKRVARDREAEKGRDHDTGQRIDIERARDRRKREDRDGGGELLTHADQVAPALGGCPVAHTCAGQEQDRHDTGDQPGRPGRDAQHRRPDDGDEHPSAHGDEARRADVSDFLCMVGVLVRPLQLRIQKAQRPSVMPVPAGGKTTASVYGGVVPYLTDRLSKTRLALPCAAETVAAGGERLEDSGTEDICASARAVHRHGGRGLRYRGGGDFPHGRPARLRRLSAAQPMFWIPIRHACTTRHSGSCGGVRLILNERGFVLFGLRPVLHFASECRLVRS